MEKGVYKFQLVEVEAPKASESGKSVTFFAKCRVVEGPMINKELQIAFNTKTSSMSILGAMQWFPHRDIMKIAAAVLKVKLDDVPLNLDTDTIRNRTFDGVVGVAITDDGNVVNTINQFLPEGAGAGTVAF